MENLMNNQIIYFSTTTCGPCKVMKPIVEKVVGERGIKIEYLSIDTIENGRELASEFNVRSVPTMIFVKNNEITHTQVGMVSEDNFKKLCDEKI